MTEAVAKFVKELLLVDAFYDSIGGVAGYQLKCLEMMLGSKKESSSEQSSAEASSSAEEETKFYMPQGLNIAYNRRAAAAAAATGLEALPHMGEILPLGGIPLSNCCNWPEEDQAARLLQLDWQESTCWRSYS